jgi:RNA recognition motif-containing protein
MPAPVGEDRWIDYVDQQLRGATDLESRVHVVELFREAVAAEPGSIRVWTAYCEYFWSLHVDCQPGSDAGWPLEEQMLGRETFSLDDALKLWQEGYEAVQYRLNDSHELWNRWISLEMELLARTRTEQGVKRITYLFKNRLAVPHATWDETSQMFSSFLSEYNRQSYEQEMLQVTEHARAAKKHYEQRETFELKLRAATKSDNADDYKDIMRHYLDWEMGQFKLKNNDLLTFETCLGLYARALAGCLATDESIWINYTVLLSSTHSDIRAGRVKNEALIRAIPNMLDTFRRAVLHVPWSGTAWARYMLSAEEAGLSFPDMESIKHAATNSSELDRDGMGAVLEMYSAWCGYLKRTAMNPSATEEAVDLAEIGLPAALEDVQHWGKRRYGDAYQGDPNYRLEKIYIQFLTEKKEAPEEARTLWERLSRKDIHANSYDFWLNYYLWEMVVFASSKNRVRSPTPATLAQGLRVPSLATQVFIKALHRRSLDWPERVMEVYLQHCNDYELPDTLRQALDTVHKTRKSVAKRREKEAAAAQAAYAQAAPQQPEAATAAADESPSSKRKREGSPGQGQNKRVKSEAPNGTERSYEEKQQALKRDRENTSVFISNLPPTTDQKKLRQYFRDYGHIVKIDIRTEGEGEAARSTGLVEFQSPEEAQSALLKDGKYFGQDVVSVRPASGCTLFVTNYPPTAGEKYIRDLFKDCGKIFNVRFPSLKYNTKRRFCYVTFFDKDAAYAATKLDGTLIDDKFKLQSKYSDPPARQQRSGAQAEEREIHVRNLHVDLTDDDVRSLFAKHGTVQDVRIQRDMGGKSHGTAFVDMETKEQAQAAIEALDKASYQNRVLTVELSKPKLKTTAVQRVTTSPSPGPGARDGEGDEIMHDGSQQRDNERRKPAPADIRARTIAILDLPDTINDARARALVEPHGEIVKLTLHPLHGGAAVEFASEAEAGKAALAIEGMEIEDGRKLRVGTLPELFRATGETRVDRMDQAGPAKPKDKKDDAKAAATARALMPPPSRRPTNLGAGRKGRGGLGFTVARKNGAAAAVVADGAGGVVDGSAGPTKEGIDAKPNGQPKKLSQDDFRKLL